jgi:hypothetical protein
VKELVYRVALEIVAQLENFKLVTILSKPIKISPTDLVTDFALNWLIARLFVADPPMLLELIHRRDDDSLANGTVVLSDWQRIVHVREMAVVGLHLAECLLALIALHFRDCAFVSDKGFTAGEFLKTSLINKFN